MDSDDAIRDLGEREPFADPYDWFGAWFDAISNSDLKYPNAMTLATVSSRGQPRARTVLLKSWNRDGFVFYTNYRSTKGEDLGARPQASLQTYWRPLDRQVRIEGAAGRLPPESSDEYFASRSRESQIGAWASNQSDPLESRDALLERFESYREEFEGQEIPRPPHWGGYRIEPVRFVFWRAGPHRLHDRWAFEVEKEGEELEWRRMRLNP